ncbi:hypothetical protein [Streptomyces sp. NPDC056061]|uniref:hypothetical protein n=1 Tax=Streptomyces sp. NPDC056061 TaxID=3345700 RepID=UPI0035DD66CB
MPHNDLCRAEPVPTRSAERRYEAGFLPLFDAASVLLGCHGLMALGMAVMFVVMV